MIFLAGRYDKAAPETVEDFRRRIPDAQIRVLKNSAHATFRTETAPYVAIVREFLNEVERERKQP